MARSAAKPKPKATTKLSSGDTPKKRLGRPLGSKNKVAAGTVRQLPAASVPKRPATGKIVPTAPRTSKADLEAQIVKLEQTLARSRNQVAKLKLTVSELGERVERAELDRLDEHLRAPATKITKEKPVKQKSMASRSRRKKTEPVEQDEPVLEEATGEAETEAHAS